MTGANEPAAAAPGWHGVFPYLPTPVDDEGALLQPVVVEIVARVLRGSVDGVAPLGSSGEAALLRDSTRGAMLAAVIDEVNGSVPVVAGISATATSGLVAQARRAAALGADGILIGLRSYFQLSDDEILGAVAAVADAVDRPLVFYHHPEWCGVQLSTPLVGRLQRECGLRYIKDASGGERSIPDWRAETDDKVSMFAATAISPTTALMQGAVGLMQGPATALPAEFRHLYTAAIDGDIDRARMIESGLAPALDIFRQIGAGRAVKALLRADGLAVGEPVPPLLPLTEAEIDAARRCLDSARAAVAT